MEYENNDVKALCKNSNIDPINYKEIKESAKRIRNDRIYKRIIRRNLGDDFIYGLGDRTKFIWI